VDYWASIITSFTYTKTTQWVCTSSI